jgi:mannonate dehydratase
VIRELGRLGVSVLVLDWHPANVYTSAMVETARGYKVREFSVSDFQSKVEKRRFEREYSPEEIWAGFAYWLKAVLPVAEEANVKLAMHPDDPPVLKSMNGIGRIFTNAESYRRAEKLAGNSRCWGVRLCVGTWAEGGDQMGLNVFEMIRDFGGRGKIFDVDFRNVSSPLPRFNETFMDDGYLNMYQVMRALRAVGYNGPMVPDHVPALVGDRGIGRAGLAYCIAYMRALLRTTNEEVG